MKKVSIALQNEKSLEVAQYPIWQHTLLERLLLLLDELGYQEVSLQVPENRQHYLTNTVLPHLEKKNKIMLVTTNDFQDIRTIPGNLICSKDFLRSWLKSSLSFENFCHQTDKAFLLCQKKSDVDRAKQNLFRDSKKETNGWVAKKLNGSISIPISRQLAKFPLHPNWITLLNFPFIYLTVYFAMGPQYWQSVLGGLLFQWTSILDGCDGEVARTKLLVSRLGGWLDTFTDNLTYLLFFFAIGYWQAQQKQEGLYLYAMLISLVLLLAALLLTYVGMWRLGIQSHQIYRQRVDQSSQNHPLTAMLNRLTFLTKRENFALVMMLLCLLNLREVIYWGVALGSTIYALMVTVTFPKLLNPGGNKENLICQR